MQNSWAKVCIYGGALAVLLLGTVGELVFHAEENTMPAAIENSSHN